MDISVNTDESIKNTGRRYASVEDLMKGEGISSEVQSKVAKLKGESMVTLCLARMRQQAGITQEQMAEQLGITQSAVSKLESGIDDELSLAQVRQYSNITRHRIELMIGKPPTHVEAVKQDALGIKYHLECLARIANQHDELEKEIEAFFSDAILNILGILAKCTSDLPNFGKSDSGEFLIDVSKVSLRKSLPKSKGSSQVTMA